MQLPCPPPVNLATKPKYDRPVLPPRRVAPENTKSIFDHPIETEDPRKLTVREHTVRPAGIAPASGSGCPINTQKFYANLFLGSQREQIYPLPYVLKWSGQGLDINHTEDGQRVYGPDDNADKAQYCFCPVRIVSLSLSARHAATRMSLSDPTQFSIHLCVQYAVGKMDIDIVRGSAFISAVYTNAIPEITSGVMIRGFTVEHDISATKWRVTLEDGRIWLIYAFGPIPLALELKSNRSLCAAQHWSGLVQVTKLPGGDAAAESVLDKGAGTYVTGIKLDGCVTDRAQYSFAMTKVGPDPVLMYALPHHVASFTASTRRCMHNLVLASQMNGPMTLVQADVWHMQETLPEPDHLLSVPTLDHKYMAVIAEALHRDIDQDFEQQINGDTMYFTGKALNKLAQLALLAKAIHHYFTQDLIIALQKNLLMFVENRQQYNLVYDTMWGGIVSCQGFRKDEGADFGNTWYNDHHYHWGYFVSSAAILLELSPESPHREAIENWTKLLIRDVASPRTDHDFPEYRSMDWFVGHSWSKGIFESADGKDEESSSEDYHFTYAMYLFAKVAGDAAMRDRALIQLAVQKSSINAYMLFSKTNNIVPSKLLPNIVSGIRFENKIDYTTYFGTNKEYIHGIHMLPITPITLFFRTPEFVRHEWTKLESLAKSLNPGDGWRSLLYANLGMIEGPEGEAWRYFSKEQTCDGGVCQSWYLALIASRRF